MTPRVSFLLATYNDEPYLRQTLDSLFAQTFGDFELVAVDDASTDKTPRLLRERDDPRLRYVRNDTNLGHVRSLTRGLGLCRGEFVARIDGDDLCEPERLAKQVALLDRDNSLAGCCTWTTEIDEAGDPTGDAVEPFPDADHVRWSMAHVLRLYHPTMTLRRSALAAVGGYDVDTLAMEDYELWTRMVSAGHPLGVVPERLVRYRRRRGSITNQHADHQQARAVPVARQYMADVMDTPVDEADVRMMRRLLDWDDLAPTDATSALRLMARWRRATLGHAAAAARAAADAEVAEHLLRRGRLWLRDGPAHAKTLATCVLRLPHHRVEGARLWWQAWRCR
jgi:GT2 family glycosyltransferase